MKLTTETIAGVAVDIEVGTDGSFTGTIPDYPDPVRGKSLDEVKDKAAAVIGKLKAQRAVDITLIGYVLGEKDWASNAGLSKGRGLVDCTLRGVNVRTGALLLTLNGKKQQVDSYGIKDAVALKFTPEQRHEYFTLADAATAATRALDAFLAGVRVDPKVASEGGE